MKTKIKIASALALCLGLTFLVFGTFVVLFGVSEWRTHPIQGGGIQLPFLQEMGHDLKGRFLMSWGAIAFLIGVFSLFVYYRLSKDLFHDKASKSERTGDPAQKRNPLGAAEQDNPPEC